MAKAKRDEQLFQRLRAHGLRKRAAKIVADNTNRRGKPAKAVSQVLSDLNKMAPEADKRVTGAPAKRQAAAQEAAKTPRGNAQPPSIASKKGARTRAKARA